MYNKDFNFFEHQTEVINSCEPMIICNWARGLGKTFTIACKILNERYKNVLYVNCPMNTVALQEKFREIGRLRLFGFDVEKFSNDKIILSYMDGAKAVIYSYTISNRGLHTDSYDLIVFDGILPFKMDCIAKQVISMVTINNYDKKLQRLYPYNRIYEYDYKYGIEQQLLDKNMMDKMQDNPKFYDEFAILSKPDSALIDNQYSDRYNEVFSAYKVDGSNKFLMESLAKLELEYDKVPQTKDTVLTRQNLMSMILQIRNGLEN